MLSFIISLIVYLIGEGVDFLVGLSVAAACVSYTLSMSSFIELRLTEKEETRPYKSPLGIFGAGYAAALSILVGISFFVDIGVGLGPVVLIVVIVVFILIYLILSYEFLKGFGSNKSGKERFLQYEIDLENGGEDKGENNDEVVQDDQETLKE